MTRIVFKIFSLSLFIFVLLSFEQIKAGEQSTYSFSWLDPDKEVYVLQNRKFRKAGKVHVNAGYGVTTSGAFVDSTSIQGRFGYFLFEDWGFEFLYAKNTGKENEAAQSVRNPGGAGSRPFRRIVNNYMGGFLLWSPFYAKINTFNTIVYFDWILGLGYGKLEETNNRDEVVSGGVTNVPKTDKHNGIMWETGLKFYVSEHFHLRLDVTGVHYKAQRARTVTTSTEEAWYQNYDLTLALGINF